MEKAVALFDKLADDIRGLSVHWKQIPKDYAGKEEYCRGRSDGLLEAAIALRQVVTNTTAADHLQPGSVKALVDAANSPALQIYRRACLLEGQAGIAREKIPGLAEEVSRQVAAEMADEYTAEANALRALLTALAPFMAATTKAGDTTHDGESR